MLNVQNKKATGSVSSYAIIYILGEMKRILLSIK